MATLISAATGNLTAAATWGVVDAASFSNSETANTALTTALVASGNFTPGAGTYDGVAVKLATRAASPSGTMDIELAIAGVQIVGTGVQINVADLNLCAAADLSGGWVFFKFAAPVVLAAVVTTLRAKTSVAAQVNLFSTAAANWSRALRTTTTAAPAAGDNWIVIGELTGAGTGNSFTVTMDSIAATDYGANVTGAAGRVAPAVAVGKRGTLRYGVAAATAYILRLSGFLIVYNGGEFNIGTVANPIPRGSSGQLEFDCTADADFGRIFRNGSVGTDQGLSRTSGKDVWGCFLNTDEAIASTSLGVDTDTGWLDNDVIVVATTTRTTTQSEKGALNGAAGASTLTVDGFAGAGGGLAFAHSGTAPTAAEVALLTRNVVVRSVTVTATAFQRFEAGSSFDSDWAEYFALGSTAGSADAFFIDQRATGSFSLRYFSIHDGEDGRAIAVQANCAPTIQYGVTFNPNGGTTGNIDSGSAEPALLIDNVWSLRSGTTSGFSFNRLAGTFTNLRAAGSNFGFSISDGDFAMLGTVNNLNAHGNGSGGFNITNVSDNGNALTNLYAWRNNGHGVFGSTAGVTIDGLYSVGNATTNFDTSDGAYWELRNVTMGGDTSFSTGLGMSLSSMCAIIIIDTGEFSPTSGIVVPHTSADIGFATRGAFVTLNNVKLNASLQVNGQSACRPTQGVFATRLGQVAGVSKSWVRTGNIETDAAVFFSSAPSEKLTPNCSAANEDHLKSGSQLVAADSGSSKTITVQVRKSAAYAGDQPRLMLRANAAIGVTSDTVLDTMTAAVSTWEMLSGVTPSALDAGAFEVYVDCNGTVGAVNVDDWRVA